MLLRNQNSAKICTHGNMLRLSLINPIRIVKFSLNKQDEVNTFTEEIIKEIWRMEINQKLINYSSFVYFHLF